MAYRADVVNICAFFKNFLFSLTQDILLMLWDQRGPELPLWFLDVYVDEAVARSVQVGVECEQRSLIGDI